MKHTVELPRSDMEDCLTFARQVTQSAKQFGSDELRTAGQRIADTLIGKLSELAFQRFLRSELNEVIALDFSHYQDQLITDEGQDVALLSVDGRWLQPSFKVDCKGNAGNAQWLLAEGHKFWAQAFVMVVLRGSPPLKAIRRNPGEIRSWSGSAEVCGFCLSGDLFESGVREEGPPWFEYRKGQRLLTTRCIPPSRPTSKAELVSHVTTSPELAHIGPPLDAPRNLALPIKWLRRSQDEWTLLTDGLRASAEPPDSGYWGRVAVDPLGRVRNRV